MFAQPPAHLIIGSPEAIAAAREAAAAMQHWVEEKGRRASGKEGVGKSDVLAARQWAATTLQKARRASMVAAKKNAATHAAMAAVMPLRMKKSAASSGYGQTNGRKKEVVQ